MREVRRLYFHYRQGFLLCAGGIDDQPVPYLRLMQKMSIAMNTAEAEAFESRRNRK